MEDESDVWEKQSAFKAISANNRSLLRNFDIQSKDKTKELNMTENTPRKWGYKTKVLGMPKHISQA
jgi:hypothetical protein